MPSHCLFLPLLLGAIACGPGPATPAPRQLAAVGLRYPPLPQGFTEESGLLVGPDTGLSYSLSIVATGENRALWLSRFTFRDSEGRAHWVLRHAMLLPAIPKGFTIATADCTLDGRPDSRVVALGRWDGDTFRDIRAAWRARPSQERIDTLPVARVGCAYVGDRD